MDKGYPVEKGKRRKLLRRQRISTINSPCYPTQ
ncbi:hypothetical protein GGD54_000525 [Rhizobium tropici]|uniref:Uncharacterized protein n=1 Tax=Rhizobium tropici TaxID=398 RepID=A0ABR6QRZ7_RHITR|nr:hypothetical protein [Rhizobium tropici]MBB5591088.1 hypothetical protein [Rhizobium tropici]MBB6489703.1 hypothetical protein [Rhizobium tropici]